MNFGGELVGQPSMKEYGYDYWFATGNCARPNHKDPDNFFLNGELLGQIEGFSAQVVADHFADWIREHRRKGEPFFTTVWCHEPHTHINSDPKFLQRYNRLNDPSLRQYLANITQIDAAVGTIVKTLKEAGIYDNTMIWYTSDNGPDGQHEYGSFNQDDSPYGRSRCRGSTGGLRGRKRYTHEGGIRVPGIICWPDGLRQAGVKPGQVCAEPVIGSDVFPTMLEVAGIPLPEDRELDSTSILPLLLGQPFSRARPLYWRNCLLERRIALRDGDWKIIGNTHRTEFELYNLRADPRETTDLSAHEPVRFGSMKKTLIAYDKEVLAEGPDWWRREETPENSASPVPTQERLPTARSQNSDEKGNTP